jgi:hypothetical protein
VGGASFDLDLMGLGVVERRAGVAGSVAAAPSGMFGRLAAATIGRLSQQATRKKLQRDLDDTAAYVEAESAV